MERTDCRAHQQQRLQRWFERGFISGAWANTVGSGTWARGVVAVRAARRHLHLGTVAEGVVSLYIHWVDTHGGQALRPWGGFMGSISPCSAKQRCALIWVHNGDPVEGMCILAYASPAPLLQQLWSGCGCICMGGRGCDALGKCPNKHVDGVQNLPLMACNVCCGKGIVCQARSV
jgi:hypothetical protein